MEEYKNETVALCMPVYDKVDHRAWLAHMQLAVHLGSIFSPDQLALSCMHKMPQPHAQNYLCNSVLNHKMPNGNRPDWILWVEDDTTPPPNSFELLRQHADPIERPVMHGISFDRMPPHDPSIWRGGLDDKGALRREPIRDWRPDTLYKIAHSGTCIMLMHTSVLEKLKRPWFRMQPFEPECEGMIPCISLSMRMHEAEVPIYAFTGCIAGHMTEAVEVTADYSRNYATAHKKSGDANVPTTQTDVPQYTDCAPVLAPG